MVEPGCGGCAEGRGDGHPHHALHRERRGDGRPIGVINKGELVVVEEKAKAHEKLGAA